MLIKAQHKVDLQRFEHEKENGNEERFINFLHQEVKHNLTKEIINKVDVKETTGDYIDKPKEIDIHVEHARNRLGYLMFESEIIIITEKEKGEIKEIIKSLYDTSLSRYQHEKVMELIKILV